MKRLLAAFTLVCALTISVYAGEISCGRTSEPTSTSTDELCGDIYCGVTQTVANLIMSLL